MNKLKEARLTKGDTLKKASEKVHITIRMWQYIEAGTRTPSRKLEQRIKECYGVVYPYQE